MRQKEEVAFALLDLISFSTHLLRLSDINCGMRKPKPEKYPYWASFDSDVDSTSCQPDSSVLEVRPRDIGSKFSNTSEFKSWCEIINVTSLAL